MSKKIIVVPDIGTEEAAEVVEIYVTKGDSLEQEQSILVLETDKASVEVPASHGGKVLKVLVKEGDQIKTGAPIVEVETDSETGEEDTPAEAANEQPANSNDGSFKTETTSPSEQQPSTAKEKEKTTAKSPAKETRVVVPDVGDSSEVEVIEVYVKAGDTVAEGESLIVLESDKASMEIPSPAAGTVVELLVKEGDKVKEGQDIAKLSTKGESASSESESETETDQAPPEAENKKAATQPSPKQTSDSAATDSASTASSLAPPPPDGSVYAGPAVRKLARQLGVDLTKVKGTGPRERITKNDVREFVKAALAGGGQGSGIPTVPAIDFAQFGEIEKVKLSKIARATANNMHRSWLNVPHVTQFDDADITDLEEYRRQQKREGTKLTPVPFIIKACALTLKAEPSFNVSLASDGQHKIEKQYYHIGMAVDTPAGLIVPVIRDVDKKSIVELSDEISQLAGKARDGKLTPKEMKGGCFTVSSLGAIGGQGFTPIVNTPEVGILGVSKAGFKPQWNGKEFQPRLCLPLSLSYDHRAVNGADAGRFLTHLVELLNNYKELLK